MKQLFVFSALVLVVWACGGSGGNDNEASADKTTASAEPTYDGKKIYKQYCVTCHGLYGDMGASGAFNLQQATLTLEERITVITKGRNAMTPFENLLSPEEIEAVAAFTLELKE